MKESESEMQNKTQGISKEIIRLVDIMKKLRSPEGCSWDKKQNHHTLAKFIKEESDEVIEAIESGDTLHMVEELGDLLMLIVFNAQIGDEQGTFTLEDVARGISDKLELRHPHVFGNSPKDIASDEVVKLWGEVKKHEKADKKRISYRMKQTLNFPSALRLATRVQEEAATVGFDFPSADQAFQKIHEEVAEVEVCMKSDQGSSDNEKLQEELGDLLFSVINVARLCEIDAEKSLRKASQKFVDRFEKVEKLAESNGGFAGKNLQQLDKYWDKIKTEE